MPEEYPQNQSNEPAGPNVTEKLSQSTAQSPPFSATPPDPVALLSFSAPIRKYLITAIILTSLVTLGAIFVASKELLFPKSVEQPQVQVKNIEPHLGAGAFTTVKVAQEVDIDGNLVDPPFVPFIPVFDFVSPFDVSGANTAPINIEKGEKTTYPLEVSDGRYEDIYLLKGYRGIYAATSIPAERFVKIRVEKYLAGDDSFTKSAELANLQLLTSRDSSLKLVKLQYHGHEYHSLNSTLLGDRIIKSTDVFFPESNIIVWFDFYNRSFIISDQEMAEYLKFLDVFIQKYIDKVVSQAK